MRQRLAVQDLPFELVHIEGTKMPADYLSRERTDENDASAHDLRDMELSDTLEEYLVQCVRETKRRLRRIETNVPVED